MWISPPCGIIENGVIARRPQADAAIYTHQSRDAEIAMPPAEVRNDRRSVNTLAQRPKTPYNIEKTGRE